MPVKQWALKLNNRVVGHNSHHVWSKECMTLLCVKNVIDVVGLCLSLIFYHRKLITITFFLGAVIFNSRQVLLFFPVRSFVRSFIHSFSEQVVHDNEDKGNYASRLETWTFLWSPFPSSSLSFPTIPLLSFLLSLSKFVFVLFTSLTILRRFL